MSDLGVEGRVVVTGAGQGIGRAIALRLLSEGCQVQAIGRNPDKLETLAAQAGVASDRVIASAVDIRDTRAVEAALAAEDQAPLAYLVNAAGVLIHELPGSVGLMWIDTALPGLRGRRRALRRLRTGSLSQNAPTHADHRHHRHEQLSGHGLTSFRCFQPICTGFRTSGTNSGRRMIRTFTALCQERAAGSSTPGSHIAAANPDPDHTAGKGHRQPVPGRSVIS